jgi:drug/metabolite transporter (DMT)-like permease
MDLQTGPSAWTALRGALLAASAAALWAAATVAGRALLLKLDVAVVSFWRFAFGLATMALALLFSGRGSPLLSSPANLLAGLIYMALFPGLTAMLLYYKGLARTPASVATFVELIFPLSALVLNTFVLKLPLSNIQLMAGAVLLIAVTRLTSPSSDSARS